MTIPDSYLTLSGEAEIELKIKGSRFIGRAYTVETAEAAEEILHQLRKKYHDATHHCFAYRVGLGNEIPFRYSDDGEPNGTAGKPIYDRLEGTAVTNALLVVTRYYGGTKLGTGGLTHAYSDAAGKVIKQAGILKKYITSRLRIFLDFSDYNNIERLIVKYQGKVHKSDFSDRVALVVEIRNSFIDPFIEKLINLTSGRAKYEQEA